MRSVLTMAGKDLLLVTRDWLGLFFIAVFPVLMGVFFGSLYSGVGSSGSAKLNIAVVDEDESPMSTQFVESLGEGGSVNVKLLAREEAIDRVRRGELIGLVVVPKTFGETAGLPWKQGPALELGVDPSRQAEAAMLQGILMQAAGKLMVDRFQNPDSMLPVMHEFREDTLTNGNVPENIRPILTELSKNMDQYIDQWQQSQAAQKAAGKTKAAVAGPTFEFARIQTIDVTREPAQDSREALVKKLRSKWDISFPAAMLWGVLACTATFAISIVRERKNGTLLRLQAAPVSRRQVLLGKATGCFLAVLGVIVMMIAVGAMLGMRPRSPLLLAVAATCVAFCFVGIMTLMSVLGKTEEAVSGAAWGANMIMAMFGGAMVPLAFMPSFMATLSQFSPVKWSILALEGSIWRGFTPAEMIMPCAVLLVTGAACLTLGSIRLASTVD